VREDGATGTHWASNSQLARNVTGRAPFSALRRRRRPIGARLIRTGKRLPLVRRPLHFLPRRRRLRLQPEVSERRGQLARSLAAANFEFANLPTLPLLNVIYLGLPLLAALAEAAPAKQWLLFLMSALGSQLLRKVAASVCLSARSHCNALLCSQGRRTGRSTRFRAPIWSTQFAQLNNDSTLRGPQIGRKSNRSYRLAAGDLPCGKAARIRR